jgi:peptide/nickel transport system substrate-binding protein
MYNEIVSEKIEKNNILKYQKLDSIVNSKYVIVPLFYDEIVRFISKNITGMELNAINTLDLKRVKKK